MNKIIESINDKNYYTLVFDNIWENPLSSKPTYLAVFLYILTHAYKRDKEFIFNNEKIVVKRGQWLGSMRKIAEHFGLSISSVQKICKYLKSEHIIEHQANTKFTLFTVLNYDRYQPKLNTKANTKRTPSETKDKDNKDNNNNIYILSKDNIDDTRQDNEALSDEREYGNHYVNLVLHYYKKYKGEQPIDKKPRYQAYNIARKILGWIEKNKEYADFLYERVKNNYRPPVSLFEHFLTKMFVVLREKDFFDKIKRLETFYYHMKPIFEQYTANIVRAYEEYKILEERKKLQEQEEKIKKLKQEYYLAKGKIRELEEGLSQDTSRIPEHIIQEAKKEIEKQRQKMLEVKKQLEIYGQTIA